MLVVLGCRLVQALMVLSKIASWDDAFVVVSVLHKMA
jgi:hypothetical protein